VAGAAAGLGFCTWPAEYSAHRMQQQASEIKTLKKSLSTLQEELQAHEGLAERLKREHADTLCTLQQGLDQIAERRKQEHEARERALVLREFAVELRAEEIAREVASDFKVIVACRDEVQRSALALEEVAQSWESWNRQTAAHLEMDHPSDICGPRGRSARLLAWCKEPFSSRKLRDLKSLMWKDLYTARRFNRVAQAAARQMKELQLRSCDGFAALRCGEGAADGGARTESLCNPRTHAVNGSGDCESTDPLDAEFRTAEAQYYRMLCASIADSRISLDDFKQISRVEVIQVPLAKAAFAQRLRQEAQRLGRKPRIRFGFHGTDEAGMAGILQHGFKIGHARMGRHGQVYGRGVYLATRPHLALGFVETHSRKLFLAEYIDVESVFHHRTNEDGGAVVIPQEDLVYPKYILHLHR